MLPPLKKWPRKQPYQQVRPDKEAVHCHTFEKMAAQTALSAGGVCRSASPPCLPFARHPPARERCLPLRIPPVPAVCAASPRQGEVSAAPHPSRACRLRGIPPPGRGVCRSASLPPLPFARPPLARARHLPPRFPPCLPFARHPLARERCLPPRIPPCLPFARHPLARERCMVWEHARSACSHTIHLSGERRRREHAREAEIRRLLSLTDKQRVYEIRYKSAIYSWNPYD